MKFNTQLIRGGNSDAATNDGNRATLCNGSCNSDCALSKSFPFASL